METSFSREDRFEEPSSSQLLQLGELIAERTDNAWWRYLRITGEESSSWVFKLSNPSDFEKADGLTHSEFIDVKWEPRDEDYNHALLSITADRVSEDGETMLIDIYRLIVNKQTDKVVLARSTTVDAIEFARLAGGRTPPEVSEMLHTELLQGRCNSDEIERLIRMLENATPVIDFDVDEAEQNHYNEEDE